MDEFPPDRIMEEDGFVCETDHNDIMKRPV